MGPSLREPTNDVPDIRPVQIRKRLAINLTWHLGFNEPESELPVPTLNCYPKRAAGALSSVMGEMLRRRRMGSIIGDDVTDENAIKHFQVVNWEREVWTHSLPMVSWIGAFREILIFILICDLMKTSVRSAAKPNGGFNLDTQTLDGIKEI